MPGSFEQQLLTSLPSLRRYARALSYSAHDAEDLLQDSLERAFTKRESWKGGSIKAWTMTIMTNLYKNNLRKAGSKPPHVELDDAPASDLAEPEVNIHEQQQLKKAIAALHPDQRAVLMLVTLEGYSYEEVASMLKIPAGTVMSRLSRARSNLSSLMSGNNIVSFRRPSCE